MTRRNLPTRIVETGRVVRGASGQGVGWLQPIEERAHILLAKAQGLKDRIQSPFRDGSPSCVAGSLTFKADTQQTVALEIALTPDDDAGANIETVQANPIIMAGQTYKIPIIFSPPGVLRADYLSVGIEAGFTRFGTWDRMGIVPLDDYRWYLTAPRTSPPTTPDRPGGFMAEPWVGTMRFTQQDQVLGTFTHVPPMLPFFWNIIDEKSGRQYAQDWLPHGLLLNTRRQTPGATNPLSDSDLFEFDAPWLFERDAQVSFLFRPIMNLWQVAASDDLLPYGEGADDRTGGTRQQEAQVIVEFHGNRYYTAQDALKYGAFVTDTLPGVSSW